MARRGRPPKIDAKRRSVNFRLADGEDLMLRELSKKTGKSRTDIFVELMTREYEKVVRKE